MPPARRSGSEAGLSLIIDTREQIPYKFAGMTDGPPGNSKPISFTTIRRTLAVGDYSVAGCEESGVIIERKSKEDLYSSISQRRENFIERLEKMSYFNSSFVVIESDWADLLSNPPVHTEFNPKSLSRTIQAWMVRYNVHWLMAPTRQHAEAFTFRLLHRYWLDNCDHKASGTSRYDTSKLKHIDRELVSSV